MTLIGADVVLGLLADYRLCWISGRFSGGKTSLAYRLAYPFLERGYRLVTNNMCVWADDPLTVELIPDDEYKLRCVTILDEGGLYFKASKQVERIAAYAAKMDCIYIIPSFFPPVSAAQVVEIQVLFSLRSAGIPFIVYRWFVKMGSFRDKGLFYWWRPSEIYGVYSRQDPGYQPDDVVSFLVTRSQQYEQFYDNKRARFGDSFPRLEEGGRYSENSFAEVIEGAAGQFAAAAQDVASIPIRKGKRR